MRAKILLAVLALVATSNLTRADDKHGSELDKKIVAAVYETAVLGTEVFNKGNHEGCYRLYQGTLMTLVPMLDHRAVLQGKIKKRLERASTMRAADGAFELRAGLDEIQSDIAPGKEAKKDKPLWDRLGGEKAVRAVVHDFVVAAAGNKDVNFLRNGTIKIDGKGVEHLEEMLVELISATSGGPLKYTGKDMKSVHKGMRITDKEFDALGGVLVATLKKYKVPQTEIDELVKIVESTRGDIVEK